MKVRCEECGWKGTEEEQLYGENPFWPGEFLYGCPKCRDIKSTLVHVCEDPDCWEPATIGTPYHGGYKWHCHRHPPEDPV